MPKASMIPFSRLLVWKTVGSPPALSLAVGPESTLSQSMFPASSTRRFPSISNPPSTESADADIALSGTKYSTSSAAIRIANGFGIPRLVIDRTIRRHLS